MFLAILEVFRGILGRFGKFCDIFGCFRTLQDILGRFDTSWDIVVVFGHCGHFWKILEILEVLGQFGLTICDVYRRIWTFF